MGLADAIAREKAGAGAASAPKIVLPALTVAKPPPEHKPQGLGSQLLGMSKGLIPGIAHVLKGNAEGLFNFYADPLKKGLGMKPSFETDTSKGLLNQIGQNVRHYAPGDADMAASMKRTGGRLVDTASVPFGKQTWGNSQYGKAVKQGTILPTLVEDAGNVALVAGPLTKALGAGAASASQAAEAANAAGAANAAQLAARAARLEAASNVVGKVTGAAGHVADLPARPITLAAEGLGKIAQPLGRAALATERGAAIGARLAEISAGMKERANIREIDQTLGKRPAGEEVKYAGVARRAADSNLKALAKELGVDRAELTHATLLHQSGMAPVAEALANVPEQFQPAMSHATFGVEQQPTAGTLALLRDPAVMARATEAWSPMRTLLDRAEQARLSGEGMRNPLSEEQLGNTPMPSKVESILGQMDQREAALQERLNEAQAKAADARAKVGPRDYSGKQPKRTALSAEALGKLRERARPGSPIEVWRGENPDVASLDSLPQGRYHSPVDASKRWGPQQQSTIWAENPLDIRFDRAWDPKVPESLAINAGDALARRSLGGDYARFEALARTDPQAAIAELKAKFPDHDTAYLETDPDPGLIIDNYGAAAARAAGHDVVHWGPRNTPELGEVLALNGHKYHVAPRGQVAALTRQQGTLGRVMLKDAEMAGKFGELRGAKDLVARQAERGASKLENQLTKLGERKVAEAERLTQGPVEVAPGKYKPALMAGERLKNALKTANLEGDVPTTMEALHAAGQTPTYVPGGFEDPTFKPGIGAPRNIQERRLFAEKSKTGGNVLKSNERVAEQVARDSASAKQNVAIQEIKKQYVRTPEQLIREELAQMDQIDSPTRLDHLRRAELEDRLARGHDLAAYMREKGYSSIGNKAETAITGQSEFVPHTVLKTYKQMTEPVSKGIVAKAFDKGTTGWKHMQLALNPGWQVGNVAGNALMAVVRGGMDPGALAEYTPRARKLLAEEASRGESLVPARLKGTGGVAEMIREGSMQDPKTPLGKVIQGSYALNEAVDNTGRTAYYLWLRDQGMSEAAATHQTLRVMGDFSNLNPLEQQVKRALPFYAWQRHTAMMGYDLATKHPWRTAAVLDLAQQGRGDPSDPKNQIDPNDPRSSMIGLGKNLFLPVANMNPFSSSVQSPFLSPTGMASSLNPLIKGAAAMGLDINLQRGRMNSRPGYSDAQLKRYGGDKSVFGNLDANGRQVFGPMSASEDARYVLGQMGPLGRAVLGAKEGDKVRYDTGVPMLSKGKTLSAEGGRPQAITRPLGLPIPVFMNEGRIDKSRSDAAKKAAKTAAIAKKKMVKK